tara:strand:+ start:762 stop:983 length:222 start_codon:yes stop_codon:yes gene_type:complete
MDNINDMKNKFIIKLNEFETLLKNHDWYYGRSEDMRYFKAGSKEYSKIWELKQELEKNKYGTIANELYDKYSK